MYNTFLFLDWISDWGVFWTAVGAIVALLSFIVLLVKKLFIQPHKEENQRLRNDIDTRLQLPTSIMEAVKLTELTTERKIEEIENQYKEAVEKKDRQSAKELSEHLREINKLSTDLEQVSSEHSALQNDLQASLFSREYVHSGNALRLPTGFILLIKFEGNFGALKAIDQSRSERRGAFIKYYWWYQPNGIGIFTTPNVQSGFNEADESGKDSNLLKIGPITLPWSASGEGMGWVYFKNRNNPDVEMELVVSDEIDITKINAAHYDFLKPFDGKPKKIKPRKK